MTIRLPYCRSAHRTTTPRSRFATHPSVAAGVLTLAMLCGACAEEPADSVLADAGTDATDDTNADADHSDLGPDADVVNLDATADADALDSDVLVPRVYPLDDVLRINEVAMRCTHNSYHVQPANPIDESHRYTHDPLDVQLGSHGVRAFELDIHPGDDFPVYHIPFVDKETTCATLRDCLTTIDGWSRENPDHHLIVVWIEIKDDLDFAKIRDYEALDLLIRESLGQRLYTPDDLQGDYDSPRARLDEAGWPTLGDTRGRVALVLLNTDSRHSPAYTREGEGTAGRAMFARVDSGNYRASWAAFAKVNNPRDGEAIQGALDAGLMVASNVGSAGGTDAENTEKLAAGLINGSHMLCDDFPAPVEGLDYVLDLPGGTPSVCNAKTASDACRPDAIEDRPVTRD